MGREGAGACEGYDITVHHALILTSSTVHRRGLSSRYWVCM